MNRISGAAVALGLAMGALATPTSAQTAAQQPALTAEQAIQLFAEAGFVLRDGRPVNRCGNPVNPRVAFIDLNADRQAEAHIADVDPACYGKPGAYFAILAQQPDKNWKRLIAEDGIVGFERARTQGWSNLSLTARDSACPGTRRFNGADYGAATACGVFADAGAALPAVQADAPATAAVSALDGSRTQQLAQLFRNILSAAETRSWDAAISAFPGASWRQRESFAEQWGGVTASQFGSIDLGGAEYNINVSGNASRVISFGLHGPGDDNLPWEPIEAAIRAIDMESRNIGCHSPTGFGWVRLTDGGQPAILHKFVNYGSGVPSTDVYMFNLDDPLDGRTEAQVAADRSLC